MCQLIVLFIIVVSLLSVALFSSTIHPEARALHSRHKDRGEAGQEFYIGTKEIEGKLRLEFYIATKVS